VHQDPSSRPRDHLTTKPFKVTWAWIEPNDGNHVVIEAEIVADGFFPGGFLSGWQEAEDAFAPGVSEHCKMILLGLTAGQDFGGESVHGGQGCQAGFDFRIGGCAEVPGQALRHGGGIPQWSLWNGGSGVVFLTLVMGQSDNGGARNRAQCQWTEQRQWRDS